MSQRPRRPRAVYSVGEEPDPRFSLANERTLLAWLRTSLAFVVTGLALLAVRDLSGSQWTAWVAVAALVLGAVLGPWSYLRWGASERALRLRDPLPAPTIAVPLVAGLLVLAGLALLVWVGRLT
ncbi:DUF202 domain-containing protein [soil metagenome]